MAADAGEKSDSNAPLHPVVATYALVGTVASVWSSLERGIDTALWMMSGVPDGKLGACLTTQIMSVRAKLIALEALASVLRANDDVLKAIRSFRNETEGPARKRNRIIHNPIYGDGGSDLKMGLLTIDKKLIHAEEPITPSELGVFVDEVGALITKFSVLMNTHILPLRPGYDGSIRMPPIRIPFDRPPADQTPSEPISPQQAPQD